MEKDLDYLFNNVPLYTKEKFEVFKLNGDKYERDELEMFNFVKYIGLENDKMISYCHRCKKEFPFYIEKNCSKLENDFDFEYSMVITEDTNHSPGRICISNGALIGRQPPYNKEMLLNNVIWYIEYYATCTNNDSHKYLMMVSIELKDGKFIVRKIGQNPSMLTIKGFDFDKYKKILIQLNAYDDYKKADLSNADHFFVGAYAYLRRIFEKMIKFYLGDKILKDDHMDTKIEEVKENFDPRVKRFLKNMYGILSMSIHELDEEQSKEYYEYLKAIIDMQLEYMNTEEEKENQLRELNVTINKIMNLTKKNRQD